MAKQIDLNNYEILDLLWAKEYSLLFIENYKGMSNEKYLSLIGENKERVFIGYKSLFNDDAYICNHKSPFENIFFHTLSVKDLKKNETVYGISNLDNLIDSIDSINEETEKDMHLKETEDFIELKVFFLKLLIKNKEHSILTLPQLKYNLEYIDKEKRIIKDGLRNFVEDCPVKKSLLDNLDDFLNRLFDHSKKQFKKELFKVDFENNYFDAVIQSLLYDYRELEKKVFNEKNSYFTPVTKLLRLKYINLFQWIVSNFSFYLDKEMKRKLEIEIFPRDYISTFKITRIKNIHLKVLTNINKLSLRLIEKGYIDKEDSERFKMLFKEKKQIDGLINWKKNIGTLFTFVKMLSEEGIIESTNIWEITARYVKVQNVPISTKKLRDSKYSKSIKTISELKDIIKCLNK